MKTELIDLKLADWSRTVGMAMIERRATVQELIESAVSHVGDDLLRIAVAHAEQKTGLTYGKNKRAGDDREHMEWHAKCGCAYHPDPFPHVHPCSEAHKRPDLHATPPTPAGECPHEQVCSDGMCLICGEGGPTAPEDAGLVERLRVLAEYVVLVDSDRAALRQAASRLAALTGKEGKP